MKSGYIMEKEKRNITINGIRIGKIFDYFFIYSIVGFIIETGYGLITKGVLESRQSFLYGPFCSIYGLGAVVMIVGLNRVKKNYFSLFFGGFFLGSLVEYMVSLVRRTPFSY